jgi:hypothetical protein
MQPITGTVTVVQASDSVARVSDHEAFFSVAHSLSFGIDRLADEPSDAALSLTILCGQATECALKALLSRAGVDRKTLGPRGMGHELLQLWISAASTCALHPAVPPAWVEQLAEVHRTPSVLRYPMGISGIVLPAKQSMLEGLNELIAFARQQLAG